MHRWLIATLGVLMLAAPAAAQTPYLAIVVGLAGDPEHGELFQRWAATMADGAVKMGVNEEDLIYLAEKPESDAQRATGKSTKADVVKAFDTLARRGARRPGVHHPDRARDVRQQRGQVQSPRAGHDAGGLRAAAGEAEVEERGAGQHLERERPVHRCVGGARPDHRRRRPGTAPSGSRRCSAATSSTRWPATRRTRTRTGRISVLEAFDVRQARSRRRPTSVRASW